MPRHSAARIRPGVRSVDRALSRGLHLAVSLIGVCRFTIFRILSNPPKFLNLRVLVAVCGSIALGSLLLERSRGLDARHCEARIRSVLSFVGRHALVSVRFCARLGSGLSVFDFTNIVKSF